jgi:hypothetical protein
VILLESACGLKKKADHQPAGQEARLPRKPCRNSFDSDGVAPTAVTQWRLCANNPQEDPFSHFS